MTAGIINVLKPCGMTSHDVISFMRRVLNTKKIGHSGTLDPDAAGVLPVFAGTATRLLEYALEDGKSYRAEITFGVKTDTGDDSGAVMQTSELPTCSADEFATVLKEFTGVQKQLPPMYSALKLNGQPLYKLARKGIEVEREAREIFISRLELISFNPQKAVLDVECSKGTYIRTLLEDICARLGVCGTMSFLLRTSAGGFKIEDAVTLQELEAEPLRYLLPEETAVMHLAEAVLTERQAWRITQGVATSMSGMADGLYRLKGQSGEFYGIGKAAGGVMKGVKILHQADKPQELI